MTKLHKAKFLDERGIEWRINNSRTMEAFVKMTTSSGDDCSEWIDASDFIEQTKRTRGLFFILEKIGTTPLTGQ